MAKSLLAHLYSRIRGSQEDIATLSLQYLLSQSAELNETFTRLLSQHLGVALDGGIQYRCQSVGEEQERPDMAGIDEVGREVVLCEMKFYAGLTANQPLTYLKRLKNEGGRGLVFVCPKARQASLWAKLQQLCAAEATEEVFHWCMKVDGIPMAVLTWAEVLDQLRHVAAASAVELLADIQQLEGYCAQMDSDAFIPFRAEDLTAEMARRVESIYAMVDETIALLDADKNIRTSRKGLKASGNRYGYGRGMAVEKFFIVLNYDIRCWKNSGSCETPIWLSIRDQNWRQSDQNIPRLLDSLPATKKDMIDGYTTIALEPLLDATFDEVCEDLKRQIISYLDLLKTEE